MKVQVNSDKTIAVDASLKAFVEQEVGSGLKRFGDRLTRAEVHLSDIDGGKHGQPDKRVLIEVRPAGGHPMSATAISPKVASSVKQATAKVRRALTTYFDRHPKTVTVSGAPSKKKRPIKKKVSVKSATKTAPKAAAKKAAKPAVTAKKKVASKPAKKTTAAPAPVEGRSAKKTPIFQARRKNWPTR